MSEKSFSAPGRYFAICHTSDHKGFFTIWFDYPGQAVCGKEACWYFIEKNPTLCPKVIMPAEILFTQEERKILQHGLKCVDWVPTDNTNQQVARELVKNFPDA